MNTTAISMVSFRMRFKIATALTFFPCLLLYPLKYPVREMVTLAAWLLPFPSIAGGICVLLFPVMMSETYGYYFFNVLCCAMTFILMRSVVKSQRLNEITISDLYHFARFCILGTIVLAAIQIITGPTPWVWIDKSILLAAKRGFGFRTEPSLLAAPFAIYLSLLTAQIIDRRKHQAYLSNKLILEGVIISLALLGVTRSILVAAALLCFSPIFILNMRYLMFLIACAIAVFSMFVERIAKGIIKSDGIVQLFTSSSDSWRSIPDIAIIANWDKFLLPVGPSEVREKITDAIISSFGIKEYGIQNTYSTFAASAVSFGLIITAALFFLGIKDGAINLLRPVRLVTVWFMFFLTVWIAMPKYEAGGWIALGFVVYSLRLSKSSEIEAKQKDL